MNTEATNSKSVSSLASSMSSATIKDGTDQEAGPSNKETPHGTAQFKFSTETLALLDIPTPGPSRNDPRAAYPAESKVVYLRLKDLYRKKLNLAQMIVRAQQGTVTGVTPKACDFKLPVPQRLTQQAQYSEHWLTITREAKTKLTHLYLKALQEIFNQTCESIIANLEELAKILSAEQLTEVKNALKDGYTKAATSRSSGKPSEEEKPAKKRKAAPTSAPRKPFKTVKRRKTEKKN